MKLIKRHLSGSIYCSIIMALLLLLLLNPTAFARTSSAANFLFDQAMKYYELEDYEQALSELNKVLLANPEHAQALIYIQIIKQEMGLLERDLDLLELNEELDEAETLFEAEAEVASEEEALPKEILLKKEIALPREVESELERDEIAREFIVSKEAIVSSERTIVSEEVIRPEVCAEAGGYDREGTRSEYILGVGDVVEVTVWRHDELNRTATIRPDGRISLPLIGEIKASCLTPRQLNEVIARKHQRYIRQPQVDIFVKSFASKRILVLGEVNSPGIYQIATPLTALEAVLRAGGHKKNSAVLKSVMIIRNPYSARPRIISADLWSAVYKKRYDKDVALQSGDIVYVPKSFFGKVSDFISLLNSYVRPTADTYFGYSIGLD